MWQGGFPVFSDFFSNHQNVKKNLVHAVIDRKIFEGGKLDAVPVR